MKKIKIIMGIPILIEVLDNSVTEKDIEDIYKYFHSVDEKFSTYKPESEISLINKGVITGKKYSDDMKEVFRLSEETKNLTKGYFDIVHNDFIDPSGLVKGWAIYNASKLLQKKGFKKFFIDAGGDIQAEGKIWTVGIRNPFNESEIIKVVTIKDKGIATSGSYNRGQHIYNPHSELTQTTDIVSISVIGPNVYEADRFATAAFAMGKKGIHFIENLSGFEGYMIDNKGVATFTSSFDTYIKNS